MAEMAALLAKVLVAASALGTFPAGVQSLDDHCLPDSRRIDSFSDGFYHGTCLMAEDRPVPVDRGLSTKRVLCPRVVSHEIAEIRSAHATSQRFQKHLAWPRSGEAHGLHMHGFGRGENKGAGRGKRGSSWHGVVSFGMPATAVLTHEIFVKVEPESSNETNRYPERRNRRPVCRKNDGYRLCKFMVDTLNFKPSRAAARVFQEQRHVGQNRNRVFFRHF
jgi:hypothetical protein